MGSLSDSAPKHGSEFRARLRAAAEITEPQLRLDALTELARGDLGYSEYLQLNRTLDTLHSKAHESHPQVRVAITGSSTLNHLVPAIRVAGLSKNLLVDVYCGQIGQYRQDILAPNSPLAEFRPDFLILALTAGDVIGGIPVAGDRDAVESALAESVNDLRSLWRRAKDLVGSTVIQQSFLDVSPPLFGNHDRLIAGAPGRLVSRLNSELAEAASADDVLWLDIARASAREGIDAWFDARLWLQGKMEISPQASGRYGELLARLIGAQYGRSKKCLVLDLDNTLWGGVVGDDGIEGIVLGEGSALGEAHLALQKYARLLKDRGVLLAVCSKNEWSIVSDVFDRHPEMLLRRDDIAAFLVNWNDKAANIESLAKQLNIGLDSLVFVDDNPAERARIRESLPMVSVPELPDDPAHYVRVIAEAGYFEATALTDEDKNRAALYAANTERDALRASAQDLESFLRGLEMTVTYGSIRSVDIVRAAQLINKTNQFNTTTRRMSIEELSAFVNEPGNRVLQFRLEDRFGDNGLVSVMLFRRDSLVPDTLELVNWVMSCRVFGRQLEHEALDIAVEQARQRGYLGLSASFIPTAKNVVIADLFRDLGFSWIEAGDDGASRWQLDLGSHKYIGTTISRRAQADDE